MPRAKEDVEGPPDGGSERVDKKDMPKPEPRPGHFPPQKVEPEEDADKGSKPK
jgi:hypothetical protein